MSLQYVYFILDAERRAIKIGFSGSPRSRLASLQIAHAVPLRLLGVVEAVPAAEGQLHRMFARQRLMGEWFADSRALREEVDYRRELVTDADLARLLGQERRWVSRLAERPDPVLEHVEDARNGHLAFHISDVRGWLVSRGLHSLLPKVRPSKLLAGPGYFDAWPEDDTEGTRP